MVKPATYELPPLNHAFGKPLDRYNPGAAVCVREWNVHTVSEKDQPECDFTRLNKYTMAKGMKSTERRHLRQMSDFNKTPIVLAPKNVTPLNLNAKSIK
jgi:hypothetical protein